MKNLLNQSKVQLSLALLTILLLNLFVSFNIQALFSVFLVVISTVVSDFLFLKIRKVKLFFPSAAIATGLIIGLLTDPNLSLYLPILVSITAMFAKNFLRVGRHIFNPAGFGLILISFTGAAVSWWGVAWQMPDLSAPLSFLPFLILLSPAFVSAYRMKRWRIIFSFFLLYSLGQLVFFRSLSVQTLFDPTVLFFSIVMLPEPMTTPNHPSRQILFGSFVGTLVILLSIFLLPIVKISLDPLILSLLIANLIFFKFR